MSPMEFLIAGLGVWRLATLVTQDDGPEAVLAKARRWLTGNQEIQAGSLGQLITCPYCLSVWLGLAAVLSWYAAPGLTIAALSPLAVAAMTSLLQQLTFDRPRDDLPSGPPQDNMLSG